MDPEPRLIGGAFCVPRADRCQPVQEDPAGGRHPQRVRTFSSGDALARETREGAVRQVQECGLGHQFVCLRCPICEPDEVAIKRAERRYELERLATELMSHEAPRHWGRNRSADDDPNYGARVLEALAGTA